MTAGNFVRGFNYWFFLFFDWSFYRSYGICSFFKDVKWNIKGGARIACRETKQAMPFEQEPNYKIKQNLKFIINFYVFLQQFRALILPVNNLFRWY